VSLASGSGPAARATLERNARHVTPLRYTKLALIALLLLAAPTSAAELKKKTAETFERYARATEAHMDGELAKGDAFLWVDRQGNRRAAFLDQLRGGKLVIERLKTLDAAGKDIKDDDGLIHHWIGTIFIPGGTLQHTVALIQDYNNHAKYFSPEVEQCRIIEHNGNFYKVFFRFRKHKVITVVTNTDHEVTYYPISATRSYSRSYTTRIAEVDNPGEPDEKEKPVGNDGGYLWRLYTYWQFEERDGGVYVQCESISLTRDIPLLMAWLKPFVESVPRQSVEFTLTKTREALQQKNRETGK
jgi:hypothetical protein